MKNLIKSGLINKYLLFLDNYKNIGIDDKESIILLHVFRMQEDPKYLMHFDDFCASTSMSKSDVEDVFESLVSKKLIKINFKKGWKIDVSKIWDEIISYVEAKEELESIDNLEEKIFGITNKKLKSSELKYLKKNIDSGNFDEIDLVINKFISEKQNVDFQTLEETIEMEIGKSKKDEEIINYNWLENK